METIIRFDRVHFSFEHDKLILDEASFSVKKGMKVALMGQNGAGKSTLFKLITKDLKPESGQISLDPKMTVAVAYQVIAPADKNLTIEDYFKKDWKSDIYELKSKMSSILASVNLTAKTDTQISSLSGGQQARLLLAAALIQNPDILLLDEPTNNLDYSGIAYLTDFLINYKKTCIVISHDAEFLNAFTMGVLYLDNHTKKIEQYAGNYNDVVADIAARIEKEQRQNAQMERGIQENKDKANFFAQKGGKMRNVAKKMREKIEEMESDKVEVRKEDKTIRPFTIPVQENIAFETVTISSYTVIHNHQIVQKKSNIILTRDRHLLIVGPNGMGKSTLIETLAANKTPGLEISKNVRVGYYRQDFSTLDFNDTVYNCLQKALLESGDPLNEHTLRSTAAGFLIASDVMNTKIGSLSEGQKGLVSFARLVLLKPGVLILDEPTNHINFRHIPRIAEAVNAYKGILILVSHVYDFVAQIRIDSVLDLER
jgi:ATPase subunit of ABC transporter with duplicated ATPase domains